MGDADAPLGPTPTRELVLPKIRAHYPAAEQELVLAALDAYEDETPAGRVRVAFRKRTGRST